MTIYTNTDSVRRVWAGLVTADGSTVDLEPGGSVDLDVEVLDDPWLKPANPPAPDGEKPDGQATDGEKPAETPGDVDNEIQLLEGKIHDLEAEQPGPPAAAGA